MWEVGEGGTLVSRRREREACYSKEWTCVTSPARLRAPEQPGMTEESCEDTLVAGDDLPSYLEKADTEDVWQVRLSSCSPSTMEAGSYWGFVWLPES